MDVLFTISPQIRGIVPKAQDLVISFCLGEWELLPEFDIKAIQVRRVMYLLNDKTGQTNNLRGKHIM